MKNKRLICVTRSGRLGCYWWEWVWRKINRLLFLQTSDYKATETQSLNNWIHERIFFEGFNHRLDVGDSEGRWFAVCTYRKWSRCCREGTVRGGAGRSGGRRSWQVGELSVVLKPPAAASPGGEHRPGPELRRRALFTCSPTFPRSKKSTFHFEIVDFGGFPSYLCGY